MNAAYSLQTLDVVAAPTSNYFDEISKNEVMSNADKEDNEEDTGSKEGESAEGNVGVTEDDGGERMTGRQTTKKKLPAKWLRRTTPWTLAVEKRVQLLTHRTWTANLFRQMMDRQMTTPPWGRGRTRTVPPLRERKRTPRATDPRTATPPWGRGRTRSVLPLRGRKRSRPSLREKINKLKNLTIKHMSERALVSAALPHDTDSYETWRKVG